MAFITTNRILNGLFTLVLYTLYQSLVICDEHTISLFQLIHLGGDFTTDFDGEIAKLRIEKVYPEDEGEYSCVAYNDLGKSITSACLIVDSEYF